MLVKWIVPLKFPTLALPIVDGVTVTVCVWPAALSAKPETKGY